MKKKGNIVMFYLEIFSRDSQLPAKTYNAAYSKNQIFLFENKNKITMDQNSQKNRLVCKTIHREAPLPKKFRLFFVLKLGSEPNKKNVLPTYTHHKTLQLFIRQKGNVFELKNKNNDTNKEKKLAFISFFFTFLRVCFRFVFDFLFL